MAEKNYWHIQMNQPWGRGEQTIDSKLMLQEINPIIGTGEWDNFQCDNFKNSLQVGDIVLVHEGQKVIALCKIKSDCFQDISLQNKYLHQNFRYVEILDWENSIQIFPQTQGTLQRLHNNQTSSWIFINNWYNKITSMKQFKEISNLLQSNKNIIFTGAPGTGKTYLAKQIAMQLIGVAKEEDLKSNPQYAFVQFHPSYDYTDFVEGLRPTKPDENGDIGFERKDGIFKEFCKRAIRCSYATNEINKALEWFKKEMDGKEIQCHKQLSKSFKISVLEDKIFAIPNSGKQYLVPDEKIAKYLKTRKYDPNHETYPPSIGKYIEEHYSPELKSSIKNEQETLLPFVFIIDEINRGEISKIFGELFFSIDPSYRGEKGKVQTQYANLIEDGDIFKEGFYVPENVYIIGTMNDIDHSVESFDFAMRRRFTWVEITAEESAENMKLSNTTKNKMKNLNTAINNISGLNSSYHIGGAYFLDKDGKERTDYDEIWKLRLRPLLFEYLRGMPESETEKLDKELKIAYENDRQ